VAAKQVILGITNKFFNPTPNDGSQMNLEKYACHTRFNKNISDTCFIFFEMLILSLIGTGIEIRT
jgi:hypothetical protein